MVHLFPHWNWDSNSKVEVWAYSNGAEVELFVNGKSFGRSPSGNFSHAVWKAVPYTPGNIKAVAYDSSNVTIATQTIETTGEPAALEVFCHFCYQLFYFFFLFVNRYLRRFAYNTYITVKYA